MLLISVVKRVTDFLHGFSVTLLLSLVTGVTDFLYGFSVTLLLSMVTECHVVSLHCDKLSFLISSSGKKNMFVSANMLKSKRVGRLEKLFILRLIFFRKNYRVGRDNGIFLFIFLSK